MKQQQGESASDFWTHILKSVLLHSLLLVSVAAVFHTAKSRKPFLLPGNSRGVHMLTYYALGSKNRGDAVAERKTTRTPNAAIRSAKTHQPSQTAAPTAQADMESGTSTSTTSGLGKGNLNIATMKYFPYPKVPLPRGTNGNLIFEAVIDDQGAITELTVEHGLSPEVNEAAAAIVRTWTFRPATRDGVAVASAQELVFHFERS